MMSQTQPFKIGQGMPIVTAWQRPAPLWGMLGKSAAGFRCPFCREWSEVPAASLGGEVACPCCRREVRLNSFTIKGDWRAVAEDA